MKIYELINMLNPYNPLSEVIATWNGLTANIDVY